MINLRRGKRCFPIKEIVEFISSFHYIVFKEKKGLSYLCRCDCFLENDDGALLSCAVCLTAVTAMSENKVCILALPSHCRE